MTRDRFIIYIYRKKYSNNNETVYSLNKNEEFRAQCYTTGIKRNLFFTNKIISETIYYDKN